MPPNELRKDYFLDRWAVIAKDRARRPTDFVKKKTEQAPTSICPLCPGNENMTPPAVLVYSPSNGGINKEKEQTDSRSKNWLIRDIPNLYPAFSPPEKSVEIDQKIRDCNFGYAVGHHEVLVESPRHDDHPADADLPQLIHVVNAYKDRLLDLSQKEYVKYVQIFRNHGLEAGASLSHAHSQIIAMPFKPSIVAGEIQASQSYYETHGCCAFCDLIERESQSTRLIMENNDFVIFAPYASIHPLEFWIVPKRHAINFLSLAEAETTAFAETLKASLKALKNLVNDPPYNYGFHQSIDNNESVYYHWHLEVYPKLSTWAGFEKSTGVYINTVMPKTAAQELREAIQNLQIHKGA